MPHSNQQRPRRSRRHLVPLSSAGINAELVHGGNTLHHGIVWDLSRAGACLLLNAKQPRLPSQALEVLLYPSIGLGEVSVMAECVWNQIHGQQCFVGLRFLQAQAVQGSFLQRYLGDQRNDGATGLLAA